MPAFFDGPKEQKRSWIILNSPARTGDKTTVTGLTCQYGGPPDLLFSTSPAEAGETSETLGLPISAEADPSAKFCLNLTRRSG